MNSSSKKYIAAVAALQILMYHCWIPVFGVGTAIGSLERFLVASTYSGVDIFFFISAYSLSARPVEIGDYGGFIRNRALKVLPFFIIALILGKFIWFLPAIMITYLVFPLIYRICRKRPVLAIPLLAAGWAVLVWLLLGVLKPAQDIGIFLFRIPAIIIGAYAAGMWTKVGDLIGESQAGFVKICFGIMLLATGMMMVYQYGYVNKLNEPYRGTFYLFGIPTMLGTVLIVDSLAKYIKRIGPLDRVITAFGSMTLELYFTQMVLGTVLINAVFGVIRNKLLTNLVVMAIIILISWLLQKLEGIAHKTMDLFRMWQYNRLK